MERWEVSLALDGNLSTKPALQQAACSWEQSLGDAVNPLHEEYLSSPIALCCVLFFC